MQSWSTNTQFFLCLAQTSDEAGIWPLIAGRSVSVPLFGVLAVTSRQNLRMKSGVAATAVGCGTVDMLANALYLIATGDAEVRVTNFTGQSVTVARLGPGDYFGEVALVTGGERIADVVAVTPMTLA